MTINQALRALYSALNELDNNNPQAARDEISRLTDKFEEILPYPQDSYGDLDPFLDKKITLID